MWLQVEHGLLWVWPDSSKHSGAESDAAPLPWPKTLQHLPGHKGESALGCLCSQAVRHMCGWCALSLPVWLSLPYTGISTLGHCLSACSQPGTVF